MVKANVDMSLDDIISKTKKTNHSIQKKPYSRPTGAPRRSGGGSGWKDLDAVANHGITSRSSNDNRVVRVHITNLADSVVTSDLQELFTSHNLQSVHVNYNESGESLGTADMSLSGRDATKLIEKYRNVMLDGKTMKFNLMDTGIAGRVDFGARRTEGRSDGRNNRPFSSGGRRPFNRSKPEDFLRDGVHEGDAKRGGGGRGGARGGRGGRDQKPKKTEAELDAELEAYMAKRNA